MYEVLFIVDFYTLSSRGDSKVYISILKTIGQDLNHLNQVDQQPNYKLVENTKYQKFIFDEFFQKMLWNNYS